MWNITNGSDYSNISSNLVPVLDNAFDIGTPLLRWRDLYLGGKEILSGTTDSTSTTTGTIICSGGAGIAKNVYIGNNLNLGVTDSTFSTGCISINGIVMIQAFDATSNNLNVFIGNQSGLGAATMTAASLYNNALGTNTLSALTSGAKNCSLGAFANKDCTAGSRNIGIGYTSLFTNTVGNDNTCVGDGTGPLITGSSNICIGSTAGNALTTTSNNIDIGNVGVVTDSGIIRIGTNGTHTSAFISGLVSIEKNLNLVTPLSTLLSGVLTVNSTPFLHSYTQTGANTNTFVGLNSGSNAANMTSAALTNVGIGNSSLSTLTTGSSNSCLGVNAGQGITTATSCVAVGSYAMGNGGTVTGNLNTCIGSGSGGGGAFSGSFNVGCGSSSLNSMTTGSFNNAIGHQGLLNLLTGTGNNGMGYMCGSNYTGAESNNILLDNAGVVGESGIIRIGTNGTHTATHIQGTINVSNNIVQTIAGDRGLLIGDVISAAGYAGVINSGLVPDGKNYALLQRNSGQTIINAASGQTITMSVNNTNSIMYDGATMNFPVTTNQISFGTTNTTTISSIAPAASRVLTILDPKANANILTGSNGTKTQITSSTTGVTLDGSSGAITTVTFTTAALTNNVFTLTNSYILSTSIVVASITSYSGTIVTDGIPSLYLSNITNGTIDVNITNVHPVNALNGILIISFIVS